MEPAYSPRPVSDEGPEVPAIDRSTHELYRHSNPMCYALRQLERWRASGQLEGQVFVHHENL